MAPIVACPVQRHGDHQRGDGGVRERVHRVAIRRAEQSMPGGDDRVPARPHRDGGEPGRDGQRQPRPDEPAPDAEERPVETVMFVPVRGPMIAVDTAGEDHWSRSQPWPSWPGLTRSPRSRQSNVLSIRNRSAPFSRQARDS
jgi:hypothetical protein